VSHRAHRQRQGWISVVQQASGLRVGALFKRLAMSGSTALIRERRRSHCGVSNPRASPPEGSPFPKKPFPARERLQAADRQIEAVRYGRCAQRWCRCSKAPIASALTDGGVTASDTVAQGGNAIWHSSLDEIGDRRRSREGIQDGGAGRLVVRHVAGDHCEAVHKSRRGDLLVQWILRMWDP
jgi:hypothetical protein